MLNEPIYLYQMLLFNCCVFVIQEGAGSAAGVRNGLLSLDTSFHQRLLTDKIILFSRESGKASFTDKLNQSSAKELIKNS